MAYDPRSETGIPTENVGSLPRPSTLQSAYAAYDSGSIDKQELEAQQDEAAKDSIEKMEATGSPIVSDGEQRWSSFATYAITDTLAGTGLADSLEGTGGQFFAIFADGHGRQLPRLARGPFRYKTYAADTLKKSLPYATRPMKQAVIAPSMLALLYPLNEEVPGYGRDDFEADLVDECEKDIRQAFAAGAERVNIGIHTCPGGDRDSVHSADVPYANLLPEIFKMNAGYFLIQLASERERDPVYEMVGKYSREDAEGVPQVCYVGVTVTQSPRAESPQEVCDQLVRAADFIPTERLGSTDDCGFSPFSIDEKPNHGSPDYAREVAFAKISARVEGTKMAADKLGVSVGAPA